MDLLVTEPATAENFDAQRYLLANRDVARQVEAGLDPRHHFDSCGRAEGRRQLAAAPRIAPEARSAGATLCGIAKNEGPYLLEWVAWHRLIGFEHIVIYTNDTTDGSDALLDAMADAGLIEHRLWPSIEGYSPQSTAYTDATVRCTTRWICFLDLDEFLNLAVDETVGDFLAGFDPDIAAIGLNWRIFGSAGLLAADARPMTARFTRTAPRDHHLNRHLKTIAVAADLYRVSPHRVWLLHGRYVDAAGDALDPGRGFTPARHERVQVNHYVLKSRAEFEAKRRRGSGLRVEGDPTKFTHRDGSYFDDHDRNEDSDVSILRRYDALLAEMRRIEAALTKR